MSGRPAILKVDILTDAKTKGIDQAESRFSRLGSSAKKAGLIAAGGLAVGLGLAAKAGYDMAQAAAEDAESAAKLAQTLKNTAGATKAQVAATEDWITKQGKALGVADDELRPALARLATATGDVGKAQKLASLAMDISAGTGKSLEAVSTALMKAQNGQVSSLSRLGVQTKDAEGKTLSMEAVTKQLAETYKGQASTAANTAAGAQRRLALRFSELKEGIGAKLLPIISKLTTWFLDKVMPAAEKLANRLAKQLGPAIRTLGKFITETAVPAIQRIHGWIMEKLVPGVQRALTPVLEGARRLFAKVAEAIERNRPQLEKLLSAVKKVVEFLVTKVLPILGKVAGKGFEVLGTAIGKVVDGLAYFIDRIDSAIDKVQALIGWVKKIDFPDLPKIPGLGAAGGLATGAHATGAAGFGWQAVRAMGSSGGGLQVVSAPMVIHVHSDGLVDEVALVRKLEGMLKRNAQRLGTSTALVVGG